MSLSTKYDCGCGGSTKNTKAYGESTCCSSAVQSPPSPCCESHEIYYKAGVCLYLTCDVVASSEEFTLQFKNTCEELPVDGNNVYFYYPTTGLLRVVGYDNKKYTVQLVDQTRVGNVIKTDDCVLIAVVPSTVFTDTSTRCLSGLFSAPVQGGTKNIFIENGQSIPIGATIYFTANGETGSYLVTAYVSSSGNVYEYTVENTGSGHTPGTIIDGGDPGVCTVPIDVVSEVDICDLSSTFDADTITACKNGAPRALIPTGENDVITGTAEGDWELRKVTNLDCCVTLESCLKFTDNSLSGITDSVVLKNINLDCFAEAWEEAEAIGQYLHMNINGFNIVVTGYNPGTRTIDVQAADVVTEAVTYPAGTQLCLGSCCDACVNGPQITNHKVLPNGPLGSDYAAIYAVQETAALKYGLGGAINVTDAGGGQLLLTDPAGNHGMWVGESITISGTTNYNNSYTILSKTDDTMTVAGAYVSDQSGTWVADTQRVRNYLIGFEYGTGTEFTDIIVQELDDTFNNDLGNGPKKPAYDDPLLWRTKICNTSPDGCNQKAEIDYNYDLNFNPIPSGVRCHFEFTHFAQGSKTLADGTTPNPYNSISTQITDAHYLDGPSNVDMNSVAANTELGFGGPEQPKVLPFAAGNFTNFMDLEKNNCGLSVVWFYVGVQVLPGASVTNGTAFDLSMNIRQVIKKYNDVKLDIPQNNPNSEDFKA